MIERTLSAADVEAVALRVVELLADRAPARVARLVDAAELARILGLSRATVYERADELGAIRLGDGPKARLRFDVVEARAALDADPQTAPPKPKQRRTTTKRRAAPGHVLRARTDEDRDTDRRKAA